MTINYTHTQHTHNTNAAEEILPYFLSLTQPKSVVDVGCGTGSWLKVAKQLGIKQILGIDGIHVDNTMLCISEEEFLQHDLTLPLNLIKKYDLAICLEVVEHLPETAAENIIDVLTDFSDIVLFSAAIPGQGGQSHINEQWPVYWQTKFSERDFFPFDSLRQKFWENPKIEWWYKQNMIIYIKKGAEIKYNLKASTHIPVHIHPELFHLKLQISDAFEKDNEYKGNLIRTEIMEPRFLPTFKRLIKSLIKK